MSWAQVQLGDAAVLQRGFDLPSRTRREGTIPIVSSSGVSGSHDEARVQPPGVVTGRYGTIGQVFYVTKPFWPLNTTLWVKDFRGNDSRFVYYLLQTIDFESCNDKSGVPGVNRNDLHRIEVPLPPLAEQRAIAEVLGALDEKIELNRQMNHTLEEMARALFKSWFVAFDPAAAKAEGRQPFGMDAATARLFPEHLVDAETGPLPAGWRCGRLHDLAEVVMGTSPPGSTYNETGRGLPLVNGPAQYGDFFPATTTYTTAPRTTSIDRDLIFCVRGSTTGRRVESDGVYCLGRGVCAIRSRFGQQEFVRLTMDSRLPDLLLRTTGSTFPNLPGPTIKGLEVVVPPQPVVASFAAIAEPWRMLQRHNVVESRTLAAMRDLLLPKLLSGEIRLRQAEKLVEAAL